MLGEAARAGKGLCAVWVRAGEFCCSSAQNVVQGRRGIELFSRGLPAAGRFGGAALIMLDCGFLDMPSSTDRTARAGRLSCLALIDIGSADASVVSLTRPGMSVGGV